MLFILDQEIADINPRKTTRHIAIPKKPKLNQNKKEVNLDVNMNYLEKVNGKYQLPKQLKELWIICIVVLRQYKTVVLHVNFSLFYLITSSYKFYFIF